MQIIKTFFNFIVFLLPLGAVSQHTYLSLHSKDDYFIERQEILQQNNATLNFSVEKPINRKFIANEFLLPNYSISEISQASFSDDSTLIDYLTVPSPVFIYNKRSIFFNHYEYLDSTKCPPSQKSLFQIFYKTPAHFFEHQSKDLFLAIDPIINLQFGKDRNYESTLFQNSRGVTLRARIANKIGLSSTIIDNQERGPQFYQKIVNDYRALPGVGFYKVFKGDASAYDYFDGRGYLTFNATQYIDLQFGYDKNFIGNGYRSLFLSDWGNSYLFAKINTRIWKFNYQNLFMELMPQFTKNGDSLLSRKYAAMHHLSMNVSPWLNVGVFEGVIFGRKDHFDFQYLNPVIFYRHIEGSVGSPDNALAGIDFKANIQKRAQVHGQLLLDEFILSNVKNHPTNWTNKFGMQLGAKYLNLFGIKNLDLQVEMNRVRPFTYSHNDTINNYTHYNQPLAHPLGANFQEWLGIVHYQPLPKWNVYARTMYYYKGLDSGLVNFGGNIFENYNTRSSEEGFKVGSGDKYTCLNSLLSVSYEWKHNLFLDFSILNRQAKQSSQLEKIHSTTFSFGVRLNAFRKEYDY